MNPEYLKSHHGTFLAKPPNTRTAIEMAAGQCIKANFMRAWTEIKPSQRSGPRSLELMAQCQADAATADRAGELIAFIQTSTGIDPLTDLAEATRLAERLARTPAADETDTGKDRPRPKPQFVPMSRQQREKLIGAPLPDTDNPDPQKKAEPAPKPREQPASPPTTPPDEGLPGDELDDDPFADVPPPAGPEDYGIAAE